MESALFCVNLVVMLLLLIWSVRGDPPGKPLSGLGLFDTKPGAECDHRKRRFISYTRPDATRPE